MNQNYSSGIDTTEMDSFFDFTQTAEYHSAPATTPSKISLPSPSIDPAHTVISPDHETKPQYFSGPSHDYRRFKQQTGLPTGVINTVTAANLTFDSDATYSLNTDDLNFAAPMGFNSGIEMDSMDFETPSHALPAYFYPSNSSSSSDDYLDTNSMAAEEPPSNVGRVWPGMHSQQAEQAKADADAKRQQQQQAMQRRRQSSSVAPQQSQSKPRAPSNATADPVVEDRISQLLDQMRHNSTSTVDDGEGHPDDSNLPHIARLRREEEDLDEDERLLASEEGKRLTSKERRQLRNKVSARAFRSRRKEYISQLEGEVAFKASECNDLKLRNRQLLDQNAQLTSLTQTLLRHPAFETVLAEMSRDPTVLAPPQEPATKNVATYQKSRPDPRPNQIHVGMTMMPEANLDISMLNLGANNWNRGDATFDYQQPSVYSVLELPNGPVIDSDMLSGKSEAASPRFSGIESKLDAPVIERMPSQPETEDEKEKITIDVSDILDDPSFALYVDSSACSSSSTAPMSLQQAARSLETSLTSKPSHFMLVTTPRQNPNMTAIDKLFAEAEATFRSL